ncbi:hypothetical protein ACFQZX_10590 [Mucilaginibacter litoreus]|uniref:Uncharacterized protein n=1 Tax=Mucilaginibacter litoreus TaxID=1048221 RepID=A0ABW3ASN3_9SPHI
MKRNLLLSLFVPLFILLFGCKKDKSTDTETTTYKLSAYIGGTIWVPDTLSAGITYNAAAKTKVFNFSGQKDQKKIDAIVYDSSPANDQGFTAGTYQVNGSTNLNFTYYTQVKNTSGEYVFEPFGAVQTGSGTLVITSVNADNKTITGTYNFIARKTNYDAEGNVILVDIANITSGTFTDLPYTFKSE